MNAVLVGIVDVVTSAVAWFCFLVLLALACVTAGVFLIAGTGWMLVCLGACLFGIAWFLRIGIVHAA